MNKKEIFNDLGFHLAIIDTSVAMFDPVQLISNHVSYLDRKIQPLMEQGWTTNWHLFYQVMLLEYQKSENSDDVYVIEERYKLIRLLEEINSFPNINEAFKNENLYYAFDKAWRITCNSTMDQFQQSCVDIV